MNVLLKGLLLVALVLLVSTEAQQPYESWDSKYKIHVDKALEKVNTGNLGVNHANFHLIQEPLRISDNYYIVNIILRSTKCKKERGNHGHRKECEPVNRHFFDCVVCKTNDGELVHCATLRDVLKALLCSHCWVLEQDP
ncbi:cystatin-like protein isoform X2 [Trichomycterus rosablanca]|uniref:cystatin-like protein isoform X2 n=1 Tax=Trichomycterus rosablanca TaxID=2290929 RepID=UPI002F35AAC5